MCKGYCWHFEVKLIVPARLLVCNAIVLSNVQLCCLVLIVCSSSSCGLRGTMWKRSSLSWCASAFARWRSCWSSYEPEFPGSLVLVENLFSFSCRSRGKMSVEIMGGISLRLALAINHLKCRGQLDQAMKAASVLHVRLCLRKLPQEQQKAMVS